MSVFCMHVLVRSVYGPRVRSNIVRKDKTRCSPFLETGSTLIPISGLDIPILLYSSNKEIERHYASDRYQSSSPLTSLEPVSR
ncbi:unnamed protein product, partial [Musa acuminata var. zebrina]